MRLKWSSVAVDSRKEPQQPKSDYKCRFWASTWWKYSPGNPKGQDPSRKHWQLTCQRKTLVRNGLMITFWGAVIILLSARFTLSQEIIEGPTAANKDATSLYLSRSNTLGQLWYSFSPCLCKQSLSYGQVLHKRLKWILEETYSNL